MGQDSALAALPNVSINSSTCVTNEQPKRDVCGLSNACPPLKPIRMNSLPAKNTEAVTILKSIASPQSSIQVEGLGIGKRFLEEHPMTRRTLILTLITAGLV